MYSDGVLTTYYAKSFQGMKKLSAIWNKIISDKQWVTYSNILTLIRLLLAPVVVINLYYKQWVGAFEVFAFAAMTDLLDGYLARRFNQQTHLGTILDPLADKCLLLASFGALAFFSSPLFAIPPWFFVLVVCRESIIIMGSIILLCLNRGFTVEPLIWGKMTMLLQVLFLMWIFTCYFAGWEPKKTYSLLLILLAIFSIISLLQYIRRAVNEINKP